MTAPDPKTVREIAREYVLDDRHRAHDIAPAILGRFGPDELTRPEYYAYCDAVRKAIKTATVTVSWPDEQQPAEATGGERGQDGRPLIERLPPEDAERVAALIDERDCWRKQVLDLRARVAAVAEQAQDGSDEAADAAARLRAWFKAEGPLVMDEADFDDVQAVLADYEQLAAEAELARVNRRADFLDDALDGMRQQAVEAVKARNEATARVEKAEALAEARREDVAAARRERDEAKAEATNLNGCLMLFLARYGNQTFHDGDLKRAAEMVAALASDAAPDGRSEHVADVQASGGHREGPNSSANPEGPAEPSKAEGGCPWCGTRQKLDAHGLVLPHEHPTYCDECPGSTRRPNDDTTEDDRG